MAAPAPLLGIDPKLYRHFAAVTLVISLSVAMFASSASDEQAAQPGQTPPSQKVEAKPPGTTLTDARKSPPPPPDDSVDEAEFVDDNDSDTSVMPGPAQLATFQPGTIEIELDPRVRARMTPQQQAAALQQLEAEKKRREAQGPYRPTAIELQTLRNASALRSGSDGAD